MMPDLDKKDGGFVRTDDQSVEGCRNYAPVCYDCAYTVLEHLESKENSRNISPELVKRMLEAFKSVALYGTFACDYDWQILRIKLSGGHMLVNDQTVKKCRQWVPVSYEGAYAVLESFLTEEEFGNLSGDRIIQMRNALRSVAVPGQFKEVEI